MLQSASGPSIGGGESIRSAGIMVLDPFGEVFERIRGLGLPTAVWRVGDPRRIMKGTRVGLAVYASYGQLDWEAIGQLDAIAPTVLMTTACRRDDAMEALRRDLVGYLDATLPKEALGRAMRNLLLQREVAFPREVIGSWAWQNRRERLESASTRALTPRQQEIVMLIARGATDKEIATILGIATATAQKHVTNILQRLQVPNRAAAVAVAGGRRPLAA